MFPVCVYYLLCLCTYCSLKQFRSRVSFWDKRWVLNPPSKQPVTRHYLQEVAISPQGNTITDQNGYTWGECGQKLGRNCGGKGKTTIRGEVMVMGGRADEGLKVYVWTVDSGGKEAHAWPQLPLRKLYRQLSRTYSSIAPNTQRPAFTTLGNFLCCFTVVTSLQLVCTTALLGRGTATCHNPKAWRQGEREFKNLCNLYTVVSMGHNVCACRRQFEKEKTSLISMQKKMAF